VIMVAPKATVMGVGSSIYLRTGGPGLDGGQIVLDAAQGQAGIFTNSSTFTRFIATTCADMFTTQGVTRAANIWAEQGAWVNGMLAVGDSVVANGSGIFGSHCWAANGMIVSDTPQVVPPNSESKQRVSNILNEITNQLDTVLPRVGTQTYQSLTENWYASNRPGNDDILRGLHFSFRTTHDYGTQDWYMYEPRWAQMARHAKQQISTWEEQAVKWNSHDTYPYPGSDALLGMTYYQVDGGLRDKTTGRAVARGEAYENAELKDKQPDGSTNSNYPIVG